MVLSAIRCCESRAGYFLFLGVLLCTDIVDVSAGMASQVRCRFLNLDHVREAVFVCLLEDVWVVPGFVVAQLLSRV